MKCLIELFFKNSNLDINKFVSERLLSSIKKSLNFNDLVDGISIQNWFTPERVIIFLEFKNNIKYSKKGIRISDKQEHLNYFLRRINVKDSDSLTIKNNRYYYEYIISDEELIKNISIEYILNETFNKNYKNSILHLNNLYININENCKYIIFNNITSSNFIIVNNENIKVDNCDEYFEILNKNNIFLDEEKRKSFVKNNLKIYTDEFIENVLSIKEKPLFSFSKIKFDCNKLFIDILKKIVKNKYVFFIKNEFLYFIFLSDNGVEKIINFDEDIKSKDVLLNKQKIEKIIHKINHKIDGYKINKKSREYKFIFNENRLYRLSKIAKFLSLWISGSNMEDIDLILSSPIYKNNNFLDNNTELSLLIKKYYLLKNNKNETFINTVIDSLKPCKNIDIIPKIPTAITISISNKIDNIIYYEILDELKRNVNKDIEKNLYNALLKILIENNINLPLKIILEYAIKNFINDTISKKSDRMLIKKYKIDKNLILENILEKLYNKLYYYIINTGMENNRIVNILVSSELADLNNIKNKCHILKIYNKIKNISENYSFEKINYLVNTYKRFNNFLEINNKIINKIFYLVLKPKKFSNIFEKNLYNSYFKLKKDIKTLIYKNDYITIFNDLIDISNNINDFFNNVYINKVSILKRNKYIKLLLSIKFIYNKIIKFDKIV